MKPAYAILRWDFFQGEDIPVQQRITVKKVVSDLAYAEAEVIRLNKLNGSHALYFWQYTRIEEEHD